MSVASSWPTDFTKKLVATLNTTRRAAKVHVAFSTKFVVWRTPSTELAPETFEARPPPLDSWRRTTMASKIAVITARITKKVYIRSYELYLLLMASFRIKRILSAK